MGAMTKKEMVRRFTALAPESQAKLLGIVREQAARPVHHEMLTDAEFCAMLRISPITLRKHLREGPPRKRYGATSDIRLCRHILIGGKRRWPRDAVNAFLRGEA